MRGHADDEIDIAALECLAKKPAPLRAPMIFDFAVELARYQLCNFVFVSFQAVV